MVNIIVGDFYLFVIDATNIQLFNIFILMYICMFGWLVKIFINLQSDSLIRLIGGEIVAILVVL